MAKKTSNRLLLDGTVIRYESAPERSWTLSATEVLLFGEYTNSDGPYLDDYYLVFVNSIGKSFEASVYSEGRDAFFKSLGEHFGLSLEFMLVGSAEPASNVLWPKELAGKPLYSFAPKPPETIGEKLLCLLGCPTLSVSYSKDVLAKLALNGRGG